MKYTTRTSMPFISVIPTPEHMRHNITVTAQFIIDEPRRSEYSNHSAHGRSCPCSIMFALEKVELKII